MNNSSKLAITTVALVGSCVLAGCGGGSIGSAAGGSQAAAGVSAAAATNSKGATCKQLTFAEVQPLLVETITKVDVTVPEVNGTGQQCVFSGKSNDASGAVDVLVLSGSEATQGYASDVAGESNGAVAVPGVGDKASRDKGDGEVVSIKGSTYCSVTMSDDDNVPGVGKLEEAAGDTTNIAESAYDTVAKALGTLCNRIFGSGNTTPDLTSLANDAPPASSAPSGLPSAVLPTDGGLPTGLETS